MYPVFRGDCDPFLLIRAGVALSIFSGDYTGPAAGVEHGCGQEERVWESPRGGRGRGPLKAFSPSFCDPMGASAMGQTDKSFAHCSNASRT